MVDKRVGSYSFTVGFVLAVILGLIANFLDAVIVGWGISLLIVLGLIVGFLNVADKQTKDFLLIGTALVVVAFAGGNSADLSQVKIVGAYLARVFYMLLAFVVPAVLVVGIKDILSLARA